MSSQAPRVSPRHEYPRKSTDNISMIFPKSFPDLGGWSPEGFELGLGASGSENF